MDQINKDLENIKKKIFEHIEKTYSSKETNEFKQKINSMNEEEFIDFLKTQGLLQEGKNSENCIICSMVSGKIPTTKIGENFKAISILEINPISEGHSMIIEKEHITGTKDFSEETKKLSEEITKNLIETFHPKKIDFIVSNITDHKIINLIPVYSNENINSERNKKSPEELRILKEKIENSKIKTIIKEESKNLEEKNEIHKIEEGLWLPKKMKP